MAFFVARRLLYLVPVLIAVSLLTFSIASLLPGDLAYTILGDQATPENVAALRADMGLDQPIWWRYLSWLGNVLQGISAARSVPETVLQAVAERIPVSIELMLLAQVGALAIGVPLAIVCAARFCSAFDRFMTGSAFGMLSVPTFLSAILLIYLFAVELRWLPATGYVPFSEDPAANLRFMVLPALTLALAEWPGIMRVLRSDMIATLQEDYIALAKAKGLKPSRILFVHALKPSSLTLVTITGINIGRLIGGAVIVETFCPAGHRPAADRRSHARPDHPAGCRAAGGSRIRHHELPRRSALRRSRSQDSPWPRLNSKLPRRL
jgi:peptide/nickel transport system permease protein